MAGCSFIYWCELTPSEQAAWAQAILSSLGIFVAVGVPWWQDRKRARAEKRQAEIHARAIAESLLRLLKIQESMLHNVLQGTSSDYLGDTSKSQITGAARSQLKLETTLETRLPTLTPTGEIAYLVQQAAFHIRTAEGMIQNESYGILSAPNPAFRTEVQIAQDLVKKAMLEIDRLFREA